MDAKGYRDIEFVCTGNNFRSVLGQRALLALVKPLSKTELRVSSSGTLVHFLHNTPLDQLVSLFRPLIDEAYANRNISAEQKRYFEQNPDNF